MREVRLEIWQKFAMTLNWSNDLRLLEDRFTYIVVMTKVKTAKMYIAVDIRRLQSSHEHESAAGVFEGRHTRVGAQ